MKALLWKDLRMNRGVLTLGVVLLLLPYVGGWIMGTYDARRGGDSLWTHNAMSGAAALSALLVLFTMVHLASNSMALEREDRSAEFLAFLPPSRAQCLWSKLIVAAGASLLVWAANIAVVYWLLPRLPGAAAAVTSGAAGNVNRDAVTMSTIAILVFGVGWHFSAFSAKASVPFAAALLTPIALGGLILGWRLLLDDAGFDVLGVFRTASVVVGTAALLIGSLIYLRRFEP